MKAYQKQRAKAQKKKEAAEEKKQELQPIDEKDEIVNKEKDSKVLKKNSSNSDDSDLSDEAYENRNRSACSVYSDELDGNLNASESEEEMDLREQMKAQKVQWKQAPRRQYR